MAYRRLPLMRNRHSQCGAADLYRDKTYLRTTGNMLFNVTGYRHPRNHVYASLKYIGGAKWKRGYSEAKAFLSRTRPEFVDKFIRVPHAEITGVYCPQVRWAQLEAASNLSPLHRRALALGRRVRDLLEIPGSNTAGFDSEFGITDSLLWGDGHAGSDIDLVVIGAENASRVLTDCAKLYDCDDFQRPDPEAMRAPYGMSVPDWPELLQRKTHMGRFRGTLFSLRAVRSTAELRSAPVELPSEFLLDPPLSSRHDVIEFAVDDVTESLHFPAKYRDRAGNELVDYSVVYEGVFRPGDVVRCACMVETATMQKCRVDGSWSNRYELTRYIVDGSCEILNTTRCPSRPRPRPTLPGGGC